MSYDPRTHVRRTDPDTSRAAAKSVKPDAYLARLLTAYGQQRSGLTASEAADLAGMDPWAASKRVSDLIRSGRLRDTGMRRPGPSGRQQRVLVLVGGVV